jgi:enoyl-CoA hydratase/carnithine racemase
MSGFDIEIGADAVAVVTMNMPGQAVNLMNETYARLMEQTLQQLAQGIAAGGIKGIVLTSSKKTFFAGGDIEAILRYQTERAWDECFSSLALMKRQLLRWEALGVPTAAAINGAALGGGLEICLACHRRARCAACAAGFSGSIARPVAGRGRCRAQRQAARLAAGNPAAHGRHAIGCIQSQGSRPRR